MKCIPVVSAIAVLGLVACDSLTGPLTSGDFDPLRPPGGNVRSPSLTAGASFAAGQFVRTTIDNAAFFKSRPKGNANAEKLLKRGVSMKVISSSGSYSKVELDSGEIGFIASVVLESSGAAAPQPQGIAPGQYQVYPPLPGSGSGTPLPSSIGGEPLPALDPKGLPPEGAIPTVIDPEAPASKTPMPVVTPTTETFPTPAPTPPPAPEPAPIPPIEPNVGSTPLPPNGEE
jgi:hypothetical protein